MNTKVKVVNKLRSKIAAIVHALLVDLAFAFVVSVLVKEKKTIENKGLKAY